MILGWENIRRDDYMNNLDDLIVDTYEADSRLRNMVIDGKFLTEDQIEYVKA